MGTHYNIKECPFRHYTGPGGNGGGLLVQSCQWAEAPEAQRLRDPRQLGRLLARPPHPQAPAPVRQVAAQAQPRAHPALQPLPAHQRLLQAGHALHAARHHHRLLQWSCRDGAV